ncbi:mandelate racemase/muconate lactonizing enzyme family protein [Galbibacter mesophilus]|uniref:mandelate racemase/muconate lactonizing enzyme family protein n=1 Tax=Galbibacter mesophilus TaxID=379069 RepID=UPI0019200F9E|nr:mandelate racemase/muconate lactonizing enzyme family protein [Galbibacter mesophilus]MCM5662734.1 mandelate racemase/muconate lactonizing enzyme family protein [Galbibacter mesophilus]
MERRSFIKTTGLALAGSAIHFSFSESVIEEINLYLIQVDAKRDFSHGSWKTRQHVFMSVHSGGKIGWAEANPSHNNANFDFKKWASFMEMCKGETVADALLRLEKLYAEDSIKRGQIEFGQMALYDLLGKLENKSGLEILGYFGRSPVNALYTILDKDVEKAILKLKDLQKATKFNALKIKLFGKLELDEKLIKAVRDEIPNNCYLLGDPNRGYKGETIPSLISIVTKLKEAGLDGLEDPSEMTEEEWVQLQQAVPAIDLVPDHPLRPAKKALHSYKKGMGNLYNFHPETMGDCNDLKKLFLQIRKDDQKIMVGDDSFVGPACNFWQHIAIGMNAECCEAIEKPNENDIFQKVLEHKPTKVDRNGKVSLVPEAGFGMFINEKKLKGLAQGYASF